MSNHPHSRIVPSRFPHLVPVAFEGATDVIPNGSGGTMPLPSAQSPAFHRDPSEQAWATHTAWVVPKRYHQKFNDKLAVSVLVITDNAGRVVEMSVVIPEVELTEG